MQRTGTIAGRIQDNNGNQLVIQIDSDPDAPGQPTLVVLFVNEADFANHPLNQPVTLTLAPAETIAPVDL